jgi:hypothetical protein
MGLNGGLRRRLLRHGDFGLGAVQQILAFFLRHRATWLQARRDPDNYKC